MSAERAACWTSAVAATAARAPGFIDDGRACMAWQAVRTIAAVEKLYDCTGCSRFVRAQHLGLAPRA
jgi:hypothetical protein